uniref:Acyltransferase n=1 Tax=Streptomyces sp. NBC_00003 TaxID=2903608 RepID=A0AAU2UZC3_9ACTN
MTSLLAAPTASPPKGATTGGKTATRLYALDGLRLLAALMVVSFHFIGFDDWSTSPWGASTSRVFPTAHHAAAYGWLGVQLFFLISGFVICMSCWGRSLRQFAVSRFLRLYPAYWFAVLLTSGVLLAAGRLEAVPATLSKVLSNLTMLQEPIGVGDIDPVYWTLWAEMRFYLLFAVVAAFGLTYRKVLYFCGIWLLLTVLAPHAGIPLLSLFAMPDSAPYFVGGILIYLMHRFRPTLALWVLLGASWILAQGQLRNLMKPAENSVHHSLSWTICLAAITLFYVAVLTVAIKRHPPFNHRWLTTAGALTYPLYLLHEELGWEAIRQLHGHLPPWLLVTAITAVMLLAAWLVHRLVERPAVRALKRRIGPLST